MCRSTVFGNRLLAQRNLIYMPNHSLIFFYNFIYLFTFRCGGSSYCRGFSLVADSGAYSLIVVRGLALKWLLLLQSLHSKVLGLQYLWHGGSVVAAPSL